MQMRVPVSESLLTKGREGDPRLGEWVTPLLPTELPPRSKKHSVALLGCPDDLGVTRNRGRAGAKDGPRAIRQHLYKMTLPMDFAMERHLDLYDAGDIIPSGDILETHRRAEKLAFELAATGSTVVLLGGGHDFAAPGFKGTAEGAKGSAPKRALLNVDPHLDVRPLENELPHSGTPFRLLLDGKTVPPKRFAQFGARANRNARSHYEYCRRLGVRVLTLDAIRAKNAVTFFQATLRSISTGATFVGVTLDMDSCSAGEGTSAAPTVGFSAEELCVFAEAAGKKTAVRYFELAEVAPPLDVSERIARVAAEALYAFLRARAEA